MIVHGRVQGGVVVLPENVRLSEGQEVTVLAAAPAENQQHSLLDIPTVSLGRATGRPTDDLLGEMLEGRS